MCAVLDQTATLDRDDAVCHPQGGKPMSDNENRPASGNLRHVLLNYALAFVIERTCGLVKNNDARVSYQRASDCDALTLASGEACAPLTDNRVIAFRQLENKVVRAGRALLQ